MQAISYCRVSTDQQAQKELSIPAQLKAIKEFSKKKGWLLSKEFIDEGQSARTANRTELQNLIKYCKEHPEIDYVIVHKFDRLARNIKDHAVIKATLGMQGVKVISVTEQFEDTPVGNLMENFMASIAEWYSANLGTEVKKGMNAKAEKGEWPSKAPLGYKNITNEYGKKVTVPDPQESAWVQEMFKKYSTGDYSLNAIGEHMAELGMLSKSNQPMKPENIKRILKRKFYIGKFDWNDREYEGTHEPIISPKLFYLVQEVLESRSIDSGEKGNKKFLLRGLLWCDECKCRLTAEEHKRGSYYRCFSKYGEKKCSQRYSPIADLEHQVRQKISTLEAPKGLLELSKGLIHLIAEERQRKALKEQKRLQKTLLLLEEKELALGEDLVSKKIPGNVYQKLQERYSLKRKSLESKLALLEVDYQEPVDFFEKCLDVARIFTELDDMLDYDLRKGLYGVIFKRLVVRDRKIVEFELYPPFSFLLKIQQNRASKKPLSRLTLSDTFEQLIKFTLTDEYPFISQRIEDLYKKAKQELPSKNQLSVSVIATEKV